MTKQEQLNALESRQLELQAIMEKSDAHASKCSKLGLKFNQEYPDDLAEYQAANTEYNTNETVLETLRQTLAEEQAAAAEDRDYPRKQTIKPLID